MAPSRSRKRASERLSQRTTCPNPPTSMPIRCPEPNCSRGSRPFDTPWALHQHSRVHTRETPYSCSLCHKRFRWRSGLAYHSQHNVCSKPVSSSCVLKLRIRPSHKHTPFTIQLRSRKNSNKDTIVKPQPRNKSSKSALPKSQRTSKSRTSASQQGSPPSQQTPKLATKKRNKPMQPLPPAPPSLPYRTFIPQSPPPNSPQPPSTINMYDKIKLSHPALPLQFEKKIKFNPPVLPPLPSSQSKVPKPTVVAPKSRKTFHLPPPILDPIFAELTMVEKIPTEEELNSAVDDLPLLFASGSWDFMDANTKLD